MLNLSSVQIVIKYSMWKNYEYYKLKNQQVGEWYQLDYCSRLIITSLGLFFQFLAEDSLIQLALWYFFP